MIRRSALRIAGSRSLREKPRRRDARVVASATGQRAPPLVCASELGPSDSTVASSSPPFRSASSSAVSGVSAGGGASSSTGRSELELALPLGDTACTSLSAARRAASSEVRVAPKPLMTVSVGEVTRPPRRSTSRFPSAGLEPGCICTMYSPRLLEAALLAWNARTRQMATVSATANRSLKTMVSCSVMRDSFLLRKWIRQLSRLFRPWRGLWLCAPASRRVCPVRSGGVIDGARCAPIGHMPIEQTSTGRYGRSTILPSLPPASKRA